MQRPAAGTGNQRRLRSIESDPIDPRVIIPPGTLDQDSEIRPIVHFHVQAKAPWYTITDGIEQFSQFPPDEFWAKHGIE